MPGPIHFPVIVESITRHSQDVATFWLRYVGPRPRYRPGQFIHLAMDAYDPSSHWPESRIFSIASSPSNTEGLRLTVGRQGRFTSLFLDTAVVGQTLWCKGPYGEFLVGPRFPDEEIVLVAGGTGITPFCAFMEQALMDSKAHHPRTKHYYGARTAGLLIYRDLVCRWAQSVSGAQAFFYVEDGEPSGAYRGRLDIDAIVAKQGGAKPCRYFLSGPKPMIENFRERLTGIHAVPSDLVMVDAWE